MAFQYRTELNKKPVTNTQTAEQKARAAANVKANVASNKAKIAANPSLADPIRSNRTVDISKSTAPEWLGGGTNTKATIPTVSASDKAILAQQTAAYDARTAQLEKPKITAPEMVKTETAPVTTPDIGNYDPLDYSIARKIVEKQYKDSGFTPEEIDKITTRYLGKSQTDAYTQQEASTNALIKAQRDQIAAEEKRIATEEARLASERQNKTGTYADTLETKYDPMRTRAREQAKQTTSVQERLLGARGSLTSSTGEQALNEIDQSLTDTINSIEATKAAEIMLYEAQLAGADAETISAMRQNVETRRAQADQFELDSKATLEQNKIQAAIDGDARSIEMLDKYTEMFTTNSLKKIDDKVTNLIGDGFVYDEYGRRVTDGDGNEITRDLANAFGDPANVQYVGAQYDQFGTQLQPAGYFDKASRQFITLGGGTSGGIPVEGGSTGFSGAASGFSGQNGMRTDRHNNPVAMTTDVAKTLGLVEGVDYTKGDPFPNNPNLFTARLNGDGVATSIKALDTAAKASNKQAFYTQGGKPRWSYVAISDQEWLGKSPAEKEAFVAQMYKNEGGNGSLISGISSGAQTNVGSAPSGNAEILQRRAEAAQSGLTKEQTQAYVATGVMPGLSRKELTDQAKPILKEVRTLDEGASLLAGFDVNHKNPSLDQALIFSYMKVLDPTSVVREGEFKTAQNNASILESISSKWRQAAAGTGMLTKVQRQNILDAMGQVYKQKRNIYNEDLQYITDQAQQSGLNPYDIVPQNVLDRGNSASKPISTPKKQQVTFAKSVSQKDKEAYLKAINNKTVTSEQLKKAGIITNIK